MAEVKFKVPREVKEEVEKHSEIDWPDVVSEAVRKELRERAKREIIVSALNKILKDSKLTEEDVLKLGKKVKEGMWKRYQKEGW